MTYSDKFSTNLPAGIHTMVSSLNVSYWYGFIISLLVWKRRVDIFRVIPDFLVSTIKYVIGAQDCYGRYVLDKFL